MRSHLSRSRAFTLVELLVVIAIIAVLIGVLLPALARAKQSANVVACSSNLRQIYLAARSYATEYKDSLPWGFTFNRFNSGNGRPTDSGNSGYITWFSSCDKYMSPKQTEIILLDANTGFIDGATRRRFSRAFKCPQINPMEFKQQVHYYAHTVAMPWVPLELKGPQPPVLISPAKFTQLWPDNALFWDAMLYSHAEDVVPSMFWTARDTITGYTLPAGHIDDERLLNPKAPEMRYRGPGRDRFSQSTNPLKDPAKPIYWFSDEALLREGGFAPSYNADFGGGTVYVNMYGAPRYRHNKNDTAVVVFADGSVRPLRLFKGRFFTTDHYASEFLRKYLMIKWPSNKKDMDADPTS